MSQPHPEDAELRSSRPRLPPGATIAPAPREAPSNEVLSALARAGLSDAALDAAGGEGTGRRLRKARDERDLRLRRQTRRMPDLTLVRDALIALVGGAIAWAVFSTVDFSDAANVVAPVAVAIVILVYVLLNDRARRL
jgi:hypothetical protein